jgi:hypothetical protein
LPGLDVHRLFDQTFFGKSYYKIHREIDLPFKVLGKKHRILFHDPLSAQILAQRCYPNDPNAVVAAYGHIFLDNLCTEDPEFRRFLEQLALLHKPKRRRKKRKTKKNLEDMDAFLRFLKKLAKFDRR